MDYMKTLDQKVALITGSGRGIGRALALKLARLGARVVVNDLDEALTSEVVSEIEAMGGEATPCAGDVTARDFGTRIVATAMKQFGALDIIVSNAGFARDALVQRMTDDQFQQMLDLHLVAPFRILRAAAEPIRAFAKREASEGREVIRKVVLISSMAGTNGTAGQINYASAKAGLVGMTKAMSKEWGRYKVCVNCVAFGFIDTRLTASHSDPTSKLEINGQSIQAGIPDEMQAAVPAMVPLGRKGTVEEAAGAISLFCIPDSDYVSGQVLIASGGLNF
jgi:3-oxoacyl-[acyl-carrier protein] reductase